MVDETVLHAGGILASVASAWGYSKATIGNLRGRIMGVEQRLTRTENAVDQRHIENVDRLARIETKLDNLLGRE